MLKFLCGAWKTKRTTFVQKNLPQKTVAGICHIFEQAPSDYSFKEVYSSEGAWLHYTISRKSQNLWDIKKRDQSFIQLTLCRKNILMRHLCGQDKYLGLINFDNSKMSFQVTWFVKGPKKNFWIQTKYIKTNE